MIKYLVKPGLDVRRAFGFTRDEVLKVTNNRQEPFIYGSLGGDDFPLVPASPTTAPDLHQGVRHDYEMAERIGTRDAWDSFLSTHPEGFYAKLAQAQRSKLGPLSPPRVSAPWQNWQLTPYSALPRSTAAGSAGGRLG